MLEVSRFSPPQMKVLDHMHSEKMLMAAGGAIRSGKTLSASVAFALWAATRGGKFIIAGVSLESVRRNVADEFTELLGDLGFKAVMTLSQGARIVAGRAIFYLVGATDKKAARRIQGATFDGALIDEAALVPRDFFNQLMARLSKEGAKCWVSYNPDNPGHWLKKDVLDRLDAYNGTEVRFRLDDNPGLPESVKKRYRESYTGHFAKRFVEGEWAAPSGLIFPTWHTGEMENPDSYFMAMDWGVSNVFAALLIGRKQGFAPVVVEEMYHDARRDRIRTEEEQHEEVMRWLDKKRVLACFLDPATPASFKRLLRESGVNVRNADNNVIAGIRTTAATLERKRLLISEKCVNLREELLAYQWDEARSEQGDDAPVKRADHACDALRYYAHSTGKIHMIAESIQKPAGM